MNDTGRTIAKNASVLLISQLITWTFTLVLTIFLPRFLGPSGVGQFHLANSLWAIAVVVATFGMDILLTKELARSPDRITELFGTSLFLRVAIYLMSVIVLVAYALLAGYERETLAVIAIIGVANFFVLITGAVESSLKGLERMEYISLGNIISKAILTGSVIVVLLLGGNVVIVAAVGIPVAVINLIIQFHYLHRVQEFQVRLDLSIAREMLRASFSYLTVYIFLVLYLQIDIVIISLLVNESGVGWYGAADQLFGTLLFIPTVFMTAVFPALSRTYASDVDSAKRMMGKSFNLMLVLGVPIGLGVMVIANSLVVLLFGQEFAPSGPILAVLGIVLIMTYQNMLLGQFLISADRQKTWAWVMGIATLAAILLDLVLVPWCQIRFGNGAIGGSISFAITESGMMLAGIHFLPKGTLTKENAWTAARVLLAGLIMVAATWWLRDAFIVLPVLLGMLIYSAAIVLFGGIAKEDRDLLIEAIQGVPSQLRGRRSQVVNYKVES